MGTEDPITSVCVWSCSTSCTDDLCEIITTLGNVRREKKREIEVTLFVSWWFIKKATADFYLILMNELGRKEITFVPCDGWGWQWHIPKLFSPSPQKKLTFSWRLKKSWSQCICGVCGLVVLLVLTIHVEWTVVENCWNRGREGGEIENEKETTYGGHMALLVLTSDFARNTGTKCMCGSHG